MIHSRASKNAVINQVMKNINGIGTSKAEAQANSDLTGVNGHSISLQAHSLKSMDNARSITNQFVNFVNDNYSGKVASNLTNEKVLDFIEHKLDNGLSGASANTYLSELSKISDNLNSLGISENQISRDVISREIRDDLKDKGHDLGKTNLDRTNRNSEALVQHMKENTPFGLSAELQKEAGLRADDALNIASKVSINENGSLHISGSKNGNDYNSVPLNEDLLNRVQEAINNNYSANYDEYRLAMKEGAAQTANEWNGTHSLRFDYANDQRADGKSLSEISQNLGHSREEITERYLS